MAVVATEPVVSTTSVRMRIGGVLPSAVQALGTENCTRVTLRCAGMSMFVQTALVSVVSGNLMECVSIYRKLYRWGVLNPVALGEKNSSLRF